MQIVITPSDKQHEKFEARIDGRKSIHFGAKNYEDFTIHKDQERKQRYLSPLSAGFYSRWLLWNKPTLTESIRDTNRIFNNMTITYKR